MRSAGSEISGSPGRKPLRWNCMRPPPPAFGLSDGVRPFFNIAQYADYQHTCQYPPPEESPVKDNNDMPGHLARRFQQIAVAVFLAEVGDAGFDLTPVQYAALATIEANPGLDQITLAGLIAYDRTSITGVIDRLVQKE